MNIENAFSPPANDEARFQYNYLFWAAAENSTTLAQVRASLREYLDGLLHEHGEVIAFEIYDRNLMLLAQEYGIAYHPVLTLPQVSRERGQTALDRACAWISSVDGQPTAYAKFICPALE